MGFIRAGINVAKTAAKGGTPEDMVKAGVKGLVPRRMGKLVDKVNIPAGTVDNSVAKIKNTISDVKAGYSRGAQNINHVVDSGRAGTFHQSTGSMPPPPRTTGGPSTSAFDDWNSSGKSGYTPPPPPPGSGGKIPGWDD
jgi:hypothetical protein